MVTMRSFPISRAAVRLCRALALAAAGLLAPPGGAVAQTHEYRLDNGMKIVVREDHRAPVVVTMVWYRAGSIDEVNGKTGVAHVLEHMMFKGTKRIGVGEFSRRIAAAGGRDNAFTSRDYTAYFQTLHRSKLELALELEADRMQNLQLSAEEFAKEIKVVMEERRWRTEDRAQSLVYENLMAATFRAHPYRTPVIGWMNDLEHMTVDDAREWYDRWYAPNNAVLVIVGNVKGAEVLELARRHFGPIPAKALPVRKPQDEPPQTGERRIVVKAPAELPGVLLAYRAPRLVDVEKEWEPYALEMLSAVLSGHDTARLPRALVRESRIASSAGASYDSTQRGPALFFLSAVPSEGQTVAAVEAALKAEVARIAKDGVTPAELDRVKAQLIASQVYEQDSMFFQARQIGSLETSGYPHGTIDLQIRKLRDVTPEQVREVAAKYFPDDTLTVAVLDPQPLDPKRPRAGPAGLRH
jgi:zinc protease